MKFLGIVGFVLLILISCGRNIEELQPILCDEEPVVHEIMWMMGISEENASVTIKPGDAVRWIWSEANIPHDVSSTDTNAPSDFGSEIMTGLGSVYEYTFTEEMFFVYRCSVHPTTMFGTITVTQCVES